MRRIGLALLLLLAACGGDGTADTTAAAAAETTAPTTAAVVETTTAGAEDTDDTETVAFDEVPAECREAFVAYLQEIEPLVEDFDFEGATMEDFTALSESPEFAAATTEFETDSQTAGCDDINVEMEEEESWNQLVDLAASEAPGTVPYLEYLRNFITSMDGGTSEAASGDCETDIAAFLVRVEGEKTMTQLTVSEVMEVSALLAAIQAECPLARVEEVFSDPAVERFLNG
jgi:hypothetical protein